MNSDYRKDFRTDEQYAKDMLECHRQERLIIERFVRHLEARYKKAIPVILEDNGVDNGGAVLDASKVTTDADYRINGVLVEVKYINEHAEEFRFKKEQVKSYIKQEAYILLVNGWQTENPLFTLISPERMTELTKTRRAKPFAPWGYKKCYFLKKYHFSWNSF